MKTCPDCNDDGVVEKGTDDEHQCPTCGGSGFVPDDDDDREEVIKTALIIGGNDVDFDLPPLVDLSVEIENSGGVEAHGRQPQARPTLLLVGIDHPQA